MTPPTPEPCRDFPLQDYPELDALNAKTAAEDIEPMRARVAAAWGVPPDEITVSLEDLWGMAEWNFNYSRGDIIYEWNPASQWLHVSNDSMSDYANIFLPMEASFYKEWCKELDWHLIKRFCICMGYEIEDVTAHERLEWLLEMKAKGF